MFLYYYIYLADFYNLFANSNISKCKFFSCDIPSCSYFLVSVYFYSYTQYYFYVCILIWYLPYIFCCFLVVRVVIITISTIIGSRDIHLRTGERLFAVQKYSYICVCTYILMCVYACALICWYQLVFVSKKNATHASILNGLVICYCQKYILSYFSMHKPITVLYLHYIQSQLDIRMCMYSFALAYSFNEICMQLAFSGEFNCTVYFYLLVATINGLY